ncbi:MAG: tetratricopeptide repeat protein [Planctomycetota bacterium]
MHTRSTSLAILATLPLALTVGLASSASAGTLAFSELMIPKLVIQKGGAQKGGSQGGQHGGGGRSAPSPSPAPAPAPAPRSSPPPSINSGGSRSGGSISPVPSNPRPAPSIPSVSRPPVDHNPRPPVTHNPPSSGGSVNNRPSPPTRGSDSPRPDFGPSIPDSYNRPESNSRPDNNNSSNNNSSRIPYDPPEHYGNNNNPSRPPVTTNPYAGTGAPISNDQNSMRPGDSVDTPDPAHSSPYARPSQWSTRYSDTVRQNKKSDPRPPLNPNKTESNRPGTGASPRPSAENLDPRPSSGSVDLPKTHDIPKTQSRERYKNAERPKPAPIVTSPAASDSARPNSNAETITNNGRQPGRYSPPEPKTRETRAGSNRIVDNNSIGKSQLNTPRIRSNRANQIEKTAAEEAGKVLAKVGKAKTTSAASKAFVSGLFLGGAPAAVSLGVSFGKFSWYNYINYGYGYGYGFNPYWYYGTCHSALSFSIGFNSCYSTFGYGFYNNSPWWWTGPYNYYASYWNTYYCNPYYATPGYYYYPAAYYPVYSYPAYAYPAYYYPEKTTEIIYYPVVEETTVYVPAGDSDTSYNNGNNESYDRNAYERSDPAPYTPVKPRIAAGAPAPTNVSPSAVLADRYVGLGDIYFKLGHYEKAEESYKRALTYDSHDANLHFIMSDALFANGKYTEAAAEILAAIQIDPSLVESHADKRAFYGASADLDLHIKNLHAWIQDHSSSADAWLVLGYNQYFRGEIAASRDAFTKAKEWSVGSMRRAAELFLAAADVRLAEAAASGK